MIDLVRTMTTDRTIFESPEPQGKAIPVRCPRCGVPFPDRATVPGVCLPCLLRMARSPGAREWRGNHHPVTESWTALFPQLEFEACISDEIEGETYLARDAAEGGLVKVAFVRGQRLRESGGGMGWRRRMQAWAELSHPHLTKIIDFGEQGESFFFVMQYPEDPSLAEFLGWEKDDVLRSGLMERALTTVGEIVAASQHLGVTLGLDPSVIFIAADGGLHVVPRILPGSVAAETVSVAHPFAIASPGVGNRVGPYLLNAKIGEGGFGEVFRASQETPFKRIVAIKIVKQGMDTRRVLSRFEAERQTLALMQHPNIARVLDAGSTDQGRPYFVMELVDGVPITRHCQERRSSLRERLQLLMSVCQAVQHAHQKGIIHRDLKPSNVLVDEEAGQPVAKVIDFGIAKAADSSAPEHTVFTREHQILGTPDYMSPEQMSGGGKAVDSRSDVYSLGVLLYELLTGTTPRAEQAPGDDAASDPSREQLPSAQCIVKPSGRRQHRLHSSADRQSTNDAVGESIPRELDWIALKALDTEPQRRYQTPAHLADDLQRFLNHEAVMAGPPTRIYQMRTFVRRHRLAVVSAGGMVFVLMAGLALAWAGYVRAENERRRVTMAQEETRKQAAIADAVNAFLSRDLLGRANPIQTGESSDVTLAEVVDRAAAKVEERFAMQPEVLASLHFTLAKTYGGISRYGAAEKHARRATELSENLHGLTHRKTISARSQWAQMVTAQSRFDEALVLHQEVLEAKRNAFGEETATTLRSRRRIAGIHAEKGDLARAEVELREVLAAQDRILGATHADTLSSHAALARRLFGQGTPPKQREALTLARQHVELRKRCCEEDALPLLEAEQDLAIMLTVARRRRNRSSGGS